MVRSATTRRLRTEKSEAETTLCRLVPEERDRARILKAIADAIRTASRVNPLSWSVTLTDRLLRMNVGPIMVVQVLSGRMSLMTKGALFNELASPAIRRMTVDKEYPAVEDALQVSFDSDDAEAHRLLRSAHLDLVGRAARNGRTRYPQSHSPSVIRLLRDYGFVGYDRHGSAGDDVDLYDIEEDALEADEGRQVLRTHLHRERCPRLADRKRQAVLRRRGSLACEVCKLDFAERYGDIGHGFAEVHHLKPLGEGVATKTRLEDLAIVCANCHRMLHRERPMLTLSQLRKRIDRTGRQQA